MKYLIQHPAAIYVAATIAAVCIMIIIDYILGAEAEHLNAWVIANKLAGNSTNIGDSLAIKQLGLAGATALALLCNIIFGVVLVHLLKVIIKIIHWL